MYVIGLTGGVGSGKSLVASRLRDKLDASLLISDELGHVVMRAGSSGYQKILDRFGTDILDDYGEIDRNKLAVVLFGDKQALEDMNAIVHPQVRSYIQDYISERSEQKGYIILESAILYESDCDEFCDEIWYVYVPASIRKKRLAQNRGYSDEKSESIIVKQKSEEFFIEKADKIIENSRSIEELDNNLVEACRNLNTKNQL